MQFVKKQLKSHHTDTVKKSIIVEVKNQMKNRTSPCKLNNLIFEAFNLTKSEINQVINQLEKFEQMGKINGKKDE